MRKLKLQMNTTVNGFVAGPNGELDWMAMDWDDEAQNYFNEIHDPVDLILLGRKMTDGFIEYWTDVFNNQPDNPMFPIAKKMIETPKIVFTKTLEKSEWDNTTLAKGELTDEINALKNKSGKDIIVYGGAGFVTSLIREDLIDEYNLFINPAAIGKGMTIFDDLDKNFNLSLVKSKTFDNGKLALRYVPKR